MNKFYELLWGSTHTHIIRQKNKHIQFTDDGVKREDGEKSASAYECRQSKTNQSKGLPYCIFFGAT